jgi:hypothetical protein
MRISDVMNNIEEIRKEINVLAERIRNTSSEASVLDVARSLYEKAILLKYFTGIIQPKETGTTENAIKKSLNTDFDTVISDKAKTSIDLFSSEIISESPKKEPEKEIRKEPARAQKKTDISFAPEIAESIAGNLEHKKIGDLKAVIGINEKFQFINELFDGNMNEYTVAIDQINNFSSSFQAESYLANLKEMYKWNKDNPVTKQFTELVKRKF